MLWLEVAWTNGRCDRGKMLVGLGVQTARHLFPLLRKNNRLHSSHGSERSTWLMGTLLADPGPLLDLLKENEKVPTGHLRVSSSHQNACDMKELDSVLDLTL